MDKLDGKSGQLRLGKGTRKERRIMMKLIGKGGELNAGGEVSISQVRKRKEENIEDKVEGKFGLVMPGKRMIKKKKKDNDEKDRKREEN